MDQETLRQELAGLPAPRVTEEAMKARIQDVRYHLDGITTICVIQLDNGFQVIDHSTPASPENFREEIGKHYAYERAFNQLWRLFGFLLVEDLHRQKTRRAEWTAKGEAGHDL